MTKRRGPARPPTKCAECAHAELDGLGRFLCAMSVLLAGTCPHTRGMAGLGDAMADMLRAGAGAPVGWYARHRAAWERDGDRAELARMLRHVKAD